MQAMDKHQKVSIMLAILNDIKVGQTVRLRNMSNDDIMLFQHLGLNINSDGSYTNRPLTQYEYNRQIVHAFLETE